MIKWILKKLIWFIISAILISLIVIGFKSLDKNKIAYDLIDKYVEDEETKEIINEALEQYDLNEVIETYDVFEIIKDYDVKDLSKLDPNELLEIAERYKK